MSTDYPAQILNHDGSEIEMEGRINFTDPSNAPGGSQPHTREILNTINATLIGASEQSLLPWRRQSGDVLLDLTDTSNPTIVTTGVYAVMVTVAPDILTAGRYYTVHFDLDVAGTTVSAYGSANATTNNNSPEWTACLVSYLEAGAVLNVYVSNFNDDFTSYLIERGIVQRIS